MLGKFVFSITSAGIPFRQIDLSLIYVNSDNLRSRSREKEFMIRGWAEKLNSVHQIYAIRFLEGIAIREAILSKKVKRVAFVIQLIWKLRHERGAWK